MFLKSLSVSISMQVPRHSYGIQKTVLSVCSHLSACLRQSHVVCPCVFQASREPLSLPFRLPSECWDYGYMLLHSSLLGSMDPNPCYWVINLINYFLVLNMFTGLQGKNALDF